MPTVECGAARSEFFNGLLRPATMNVDSNAINAWPKVSSIRLNVVGQNLAQKCLGIFVKKSSDLNNSTTITTLVSTISCKAARSVFFNGLLLPATMNVGNDTNQLWSPKVSLVRLNVEDMVLMQNSLWEYGKKWPDLARKMGIKDKNDLTTTIITTAGAHTKVPKRIGDSTKTETSRSKSKRNAEDSEIPNGKKRKLK